MNPEGLVAQQRILEQIKDLIIEGEAAARGMLVSTYFQVGTIIIENNLLPQSVAEYIGRSERMVQYMVKFASNPKILDKVSKQDSWTAIIRKHLTTPSDPKEHEHEPITITICKICRVEISS